MSTLRLATAANVRAFQILIDALNTNDSKSTQELDGDALEDEIGRFRVWAGNLGALQKGHSSLDYRLRDSPNLLSSALKLLKELEHNLNETYAVVSGARLPYEAQTSMDEVEEDENDDGFFSEEDDSDGDEPRNELKMRFEEVVDIIDNLYKLSVRIRTPSIHSRSLKASSYAPTDPETGVDILGAYAELDKKHVQELLLQLRQPYASGDQEEQASLLERLSSSITLRRRHFKYWKRHRDKLGASAIPEDTPELILPALHQTPNPVYNNNLENYPITPEITTSRPTPSQKTGKTLLSGTEATHHHQSLDDIVDTKSVTSYAVTVKDLHGKGIELPPPPKAANGDKDFECPYCWIVCPARYGKGRAWKTHLLQDLQPYICTYQDCESSQQLFRSRREWAEHEATHRKLWRCPEHAAALYSSLSGLENHLRQDHNGSFPEDQIAVVTKIGETTATDTRTKCPICYAPANTAGLGDLQSHIANHLERFATFALPHGREDDSDGASSVASRGSSNSQSLPNSARTDTSNDEIVQEDTVKLEKPSELLPMNGPGQSLLSAERLQQLPDESQNRVSMITGQFNDLDDSEAEQSDDQQFDEDVLSSHKKHMDNQEAFRQHILTLPGALSVRFYRRYGSWSGLITFADDWVGKQALEVFDAQRFPNMDFKPKKDTTKWKFTRVGRPGKENVLNRQSTADTQATEDTETSAGSELYDQEVEDSDKQAIISADETPTLRSLYQSRRLLQRDQSFAPNDAYNQMISFCHYDLTRLRVDAIVNNAPSNLKATPSPGLLHYTIFQAGGSGLRKEARSKPRIKLGQVELTHGHDLPASWVIHAAAPTYTGTKGVGQFNVLSSCYRSALRTAATYELKTIAFPCLGTGGCNFPPRVAARIALQEIREYLDSHPEHRPERIIFCVKAAIDEKAYTDFLPVFFPPTHGDLDRARTSDWSANRAALSAQVLEAHSQAQRTLTIMTMKGIFGTHTTALRKVNSALNSIRNYLLGSEEPKRNLGDLNLLCSVLGTVCTTLSEIMERVGERTSDQLVRDLWDEVDTDLQAKQGFNFSTLFNYCMIFASSLDGVLTRDQKEPEAMARARQVLEKYGVKQKGQDVEGIRDHLDEVIHVRKSEGPIPKSREIIQVHQVPSVAQLYLLGSLEDKPTMAQPSASFNHTVCFLREDITRLAVDAMVNSTDVSFSGMGTLDRLVFKKGGPGLQWEVEAEQIGKSKEGDVKVTPGFLLPARHVIHVVPPGQFRKDTKTVLRGIYRDILHTAVQLKATSVAIPSIGTGMLNYPTRDCASIAMEEVKGFLESADPANGLLKIIFVVFSSNDEFVYKSLLPIYFPQPKSKVPDEPQREKQTPAQYQAALNVKNHMQREAGQEEREREIRERSSLDASLPDSAQQTAENRENPSIPYPTAEVMSALSGLSNQIELNEEDRLILRLRDEENIPWRDIAARLRTDFNKSFQIPALQMRLKRIRERIIKPRPMNWNEESSLIRFESHVNDCNICSDGLFERTHKLCEYGYPLALSILQQMEMSEDAIVYSNPKDRGDRHKLELPTDLLPSSMLLLSIVTKHAHARNFDFPFDLVTEPPEATSEDEEDRKVNSENTATVQPVEVYDTSSLLFGEAGMSSHQRTGSNSSLRQSENLTHSTAAKDTNVISSDAEQPAVIQAKVLGPQTSKAWTKSVLHIHGSSIEMYLAETYVGESPYATIDLANAVPSLARGVTSESPNTTSLFVERYEESKAKGTQRAEGDRMRETWHFLSARDSEAAVLFDALQRLVIRNRKTQGMMVPPATREGMDSALTEAPTTRVGMSGGTTDANVSSRNTPGNSILLPHFQDSRPRPRCWQHGCNGKLFSTFTNLLRHQRGKNLEFLGRQRLRAQILDYLADDLETRPGSYIGQNTENIASGTGMDTISATSLLHELAAQGNVHNTVNDDTWVISHRMDERPTEQLQKAKESGDTDSSTLADQIVSCLIRKGQGLSLEDLAGELQATSAAVTSAIRILASDGFITSGFDGQTWILTDLGEIRVEGERGAARYIGSFHPDRNSSGDLSERALSHLRSLPGMSKSISDLAITFVTPAAVLQPVLEQLRSDGLVENKDDESSWAAILAPNDPQLPILPRPYVTHGHEPISTQPDIAPTKQEQPAANSLATGKAGSWRDGRGASERKHTRFARTLAEDVEEDVQSGTASNLRRARMAKERKHNKSSRASADDVDDELEYYDGQEEDYV